jgi:REP element-mobilizing transposase RayT
MARKARVEFAGALYHVIDRGDRREPIFQDDIDRERFLKTLGEACARTGWIIHAWVLMNNHYHLMLETPEPNLVAGMRWFQTTMTIRYNRRHRISGHLFQGRYKAVVVDPEERGYSVILSDYIHLNPVRAGLVGLEDRLVDYRWSSYPSYVRAAGRPAWFAAERVMGELNLADTADGRRDYAKRMRTRAEEELLSGAESQPVAELRRGWCLGSESFREKMLRLLDRMSEKRPGRRSARDAKVRREHGEEEAGRLMMAALAWLGLDAGGLIEMKKGDVRKLAITALLRQRTTVSNAWLAEKLSLGHMSRVSQASRDPEALKLAKKLAQELSK